MTADPVPSSTYQTEVSGMRTLNFNGNYVAWNHPSFTMPQLKLLKTDFTWLLITGKISQYKLVRHETLFYFGTLVKKAVFTVVF